MVAPDAEIEYVVVPFVQTEVAVGCVIISGTVFTIIVMVFDVAGLPDKQGVAFDVKTQETLSPFAIAELLYVSEFEPIFTPFNFHW